jgi:GNAT superfamily N-acetyltransferase
VAPYNKSDRLVATPIAPRSGRVRAGAIENRVMPSMKSSSSAGKLPIRRGPVEYSLGSEADHEAVYQTLLHVFHGPDREAFLGSLSDPDYQPDQRLLAKVDGRVASHVHLTRRKVHYGSATLPLNGVMWVGTLPEYRGLGFAQNLIRLADGRARETGVVLQALTTAMPQFYRPLGWGICGRQSFGLIPSRNLPATGDGLIEAKGGPWQVRPWRQVELGDLMDLYDRQYARTTGSVVRSEDYWRWIIGRRYAHVIWVACQGETVRGYAFVKDHRVLEIATDPAHPHALNALLGRVRAEALERAYPEVVVHAPNDHPAMAIIRESSGRVIHAEDWEGQSSMYHVPDVGGFLRAILPELERRVRESDAPAPQELGLTVGDDRWLIHIEPRKSRLEPDKLSRRHLTLSPSAFVRLAMGHTGIDRAVSGDGAEASTATALDTARILFPVQPIWRSPLDSATA